MNEKHLHKLRYETETWNEWRRKRPKTRIDLSNAEINSLASKALLDSNKYIFRHFQERDFRGIDLHKANLHFAKIRICNLSNADLRGADLSGAEIRRSQLEGADLRGADLRGAQFLVSSLGGAQLDGAILGKTHFGYTKLANAQGLDQAVHMEMSEIDQLSIINSMPLPASFLLACGVMPHTVRMAELYAQSRPYHTCFISYSRRDELFVGYLREALTWAGAPSWFAPQDMRREELQGSQVELERDLYSYVDEAERLLLIVSPNILASGWVGKEFQRARSRTPVVIPILIETLPAPGSSEWNALIAKTVKEGEYSLLNPETYSEELAKILSRQFLDFRNWRDPSVLAQCFINLLPLLRRSS
jgi:hypothetical protein